jgi:hypothetical protein
MEFNTQYDPIEYSLLSEEAAIQSEGQFTLEFWFRPFSWENTDSTLLRIGNSQVQQDGISGKVVYNFEHPDYFTENKYCEEIASLNIWHHYAITYTNRPSVDPILALSLKCYILIQSDDDDDSRTHQLIDQTKSLFPLNDFAKFSFNPLIIGGMDENLNPEYRFQG